VSAIKIIFQKEVSAFFDSIIAYLVICVFLVGVGLFFWVFPDNILETHAAELSSLFGVAPWFFLFLAPAITMRSFAEEFKMGTFEILCVKPITEWQILLGKFGAAVFLLLFSLFPTLIYYATVYYLAKPMGNLDTGAVWGAYIGLLAIGMAFCAIGVFSSSLSDNQIVAFIIGVFLSFFLYTAFDFLAELKFLEEYNSFILQIGMLEHYRSVSRGVIDTRDLTYFGSVIVFFLFLTRTVLIQKKK
jgi:ABC-2 type transport system permease protein